MRIFVIAGLIAVPALPLFGAYAARDAWIPVAGHATGAGARHFETTIFMTNISRSMNDVTVSFFASGQSNNPPRSVKLQLGSNQTGVIDVGPQLTGAGGAVGAVHIVSTGPLLTDGHVYSHVEGAPLSSRIGEVLNAIPSQFAIGSGESTVIHVPAGARYKLYAVETTGYALYFSVDGGRAGRRVLIGPHEQRPWDLGELLPGESLSAVRITGVNGSGKIIVIGTAIAEQAQDFSAYEMMLPAKPRHRMTWPEMTAYVVAALAIAITAIYRMKKAA